MIFLTILTGLVLFILSQLSLELIIKPIVYQKNIVGKIIDSLIYYANVYTANGFAKTELMVEASETLRKLATEFRANYQIIPFYTLFAKIKAVIDKNTVDNVSRELIGISNQLFIKRDYTDFNLTTESRVKKIEGFLHVNIAG